MSALGHINYFGQTDFRGKQIPFGIKSDDRTRHMYVIGKTGMGKSTLLENLAIQDIKNGEGMAFIDPHGRSAELLLDYIPAERHKDVIYFAPFDLDNPIAFNIMEDVGADQRHLVSNGLMATFKRIWADQFSARMEYILSNTILALLEYPDTTLLGVNRMLSDKTYREKIVANISDPSVKSFWVDEFANYTERFAAEATPAIQNKIGQFSANPLIRNIIGQGKSSIDFRKVMDERKILIVNLSKGLVGEDNAKLLGGMIITKLYLAAMSRANASEVDMRRLPAFYLFVDEFQSFANESFADILSEARKYKLALTIAHQYIEQMPEEVRDAVFGNVGTTITFRVGPLDSEVLEKVFFPTFTKEDLVNLGRFQMYLSLMIDGVGSQPFSALSLPPIPPLAISPRKEIIELSRKVFSRPRSVVEKEITGWIEEARQNKEMTAGKGVSGGFGGGKKPGGGFSTGGPTGSLPKPPVTSGALPTPPRPTFVPAREVKKEEPNKMAEALKNALAEFTKPDTDNPGPVLETISSRPSLQEMAKSEPIKLSHLNSNPIVSKEKHTEKGKDALREALSGLIKETKPPVSSTPASAATPSTASVKVSAKPQEVPEDVLRQLLGLDTNV